MSRVKTNSRLELETRCQKIVSDIREIIKDMGEYKINPDSGEDAKTAVPGEKIARNAFANEKWDLALCHVARMRACTNDDAHLLVAMVYARPNIRRARYDIAILHLEKILRRKPEEKRVQIFYVVVKRALKLKRKLEEREAFNDIEEKDVMEETRKKNNCFCF